MQEFTKNILAIMAVIILSLALSTFKTGAKFVQGVLIIGIIAVVLSNEPKFRNAIQQLAGRTLQAPTQQADTGGNRGATEHVP